MPDRAISVTKVVDAPRQAVFDLLADPAQHPRIDGSGTVRAARGGNPERLSLGAKFGMDMKLGLPYRIRNTVVEFEDGTLIAWRHFFGHRWRWSLKDAGEGRTEVTETFDWSTALVPKGIELLGFPGKNKQGIRATLDRLDGLLRT
ncbi:SRPBCC family protein [Labedaea rhizosphaerae]|uniref:Uncharacterized protein YndB with AHSA1/START domain n=1 Tax=Labedaea rhizosphaerae TaxID=598644 RepID=A0A4R6SF84_LABRH|nr:SRPBCC family protein [Labedaea rhizosphaerae]TDP97855.1 uncharacterized protein YndB with AHSA1/START domain [Labedaea rhizosphaerae]